MYKIYDDIIAVITPTFVRKYSTIGRAAFTLFGDRKFKVRTIKEGTLLYLPDMYLNITLPDSVISELKGVSAGLVVKSTKVDISSSKVRLDMECFEKCTQEQLSEIAKYTFSPEEKTNLFKK